MTFFPMKNIAADDHKGVDLQWLRWLNSTLYGIAANAPYNRGRKLTLALTRACAECNYVLTAAIMRHLSALNPASM
jgi:hypothetical protein